MTLKFKLNHHVTAVVQITNEARTQCIFSDECSASVTDTLSVLSADTPEELHKLIKTLAIELASATKFRPTVCYVSGDQYQIEKLEAANTATIF